MATARVRAALLFTVLLLCILPLRTSAQKTDGETGLIVAGGFETVKENCTRCHSAKLIIQNRMEREGWLETIRWMQETQGLQEFDPATEETILDYLSTHYAPGKTYRRPPLEVDWK